MILTRTHIAFLGIISIFTGLVGPGVSMGGVTLSYLMTDMRIVAYMILLVLIVTCFLASMRRWHSYKMSVTLILIGISILLFMTLFGRVESIRSGEVLTHMSWGWIFLIVGVVLLILSYRQGEASSVDHSFSDFIDTIIGMVGGFALACIAGILILSSLSFFSGRQNHDILERAYMSGETLTLSGGIVALSGSYRDMPRVEYMRGEDTLFITTSAGSGTLWTQIQGTDTSTGILKSGLSPILLDGKVYGLDKNGYAYEDGQLLLGSRTLDDPKAIIKKKNAGVEIITEGKRDSISYNGIIGRPIALSKDRDNIVWIENQANKKYIVKNGEIGEKPYDTISHIDISSRGQNTMIFTSSGTDTLIVRNHIPLGILPIEAISGSYISNGSHSLYVTRVKNVKNVFYDMINISRDLEEVRETFLEQDGDSYAYFGRPLGETQYCLFTRYSGNLCGLEGYMNPRIGADGGSIVFAGKKDGIWSIYRNTNRIVENTNYTGQDISKDYMYLDTTNPRNFLFIEYNTKDNSYTYRKNGNILPGVWKDVSLDVYFGYDNHIITTAEDQSGWRVLEL